MSGSRHGVLILDPKNNTKLKKFLNRTEIQCTTELPSARFSKYTIGDTFEGRTEPNLNLGRLSEKHHQKSDAFARLGLRKLEPVRASLPVLPLAAKASRSQIKK